ncbi:MAG: hypothetical protein WA790_10615 [Sulfitobacter sp.]
MNERVKTAKLPSTRTDETNKSQTVFIAVGLAIVLGGLWLLYDTDGPYHPDIPVTDTLVHETVDS